MELDFDTQIGLMNTEEKGNHFMLFSELPSYSYINSS